MGHVLLQMITFILISNLVNVLCDDISQALAGVDKARDIAVRDTGASGTEITSRREKFKVAIKNEREKYRTNRMRQKEYGQSLKDAGNGMSKFARGMKNGDWKETLAGALDIIGGFLFLAVPWGPIAGGVLSIISSILGIFADKPPSTAEILKGVLREENDRIFTSNVKGVIEKFRVVKSSLSRFKKRLNDSDNSPKEKADIRQQAGRLHSEFLAVGSELLPHFQQRKGDYCVNDTTLPKCGKFLQLYLDLTNIRQLGFTLLSAVLLDAGNEAVAQNLNGTIKDIQNTDKGFLGFLADPFHLSPDQRKVVAMLWENRWFYPNLFTYLVKLQKTFVDEDGRGGIFRNSVLLCKDHYLKGVCNAYKEGFLNFHEGWNDVYVSAFIPAGIKLSTFKGIDKRETSGVYVGPDARSGVYWPKTMSSILVSKVDVDEENVLKQFRFCASAEGGNLPEAYESDYVDFVCDHVGIGEYRDLSRIKGNNYNYDKDISRIQIPSDLKVTAYAEKNFGGQKYGPFIGPMYTRYPCSSELWSSIKVEETNQTSTSMIEISDRPPQGAPDQPGATLVQVNVCGQKPDTEVTEFNSFFDNQGCTFSNLKFMRIPGGVEITGYGKENQEPYYGWNRAVGWKQVEGTWGSMDVKATCDGTEVDT